MRDWCRRGMRDGHGGGRRRARAILGPASRTRSATSPRLRRSSWTSPTGSRASSRRSAATARRWAPTVRLRGSPRPMPGAGSASSSSGGRGPTPAIPSSKRSPIRSPARTSGGEPRIPMQISTLDVLRCPYCGGRFELVASLYHRSSEDDIHDGILGCHCCIFPVVDGIPVLHLQASAISRRSEHDRGRPARSRAAHDGRPRRCEPGGGDSNCEVAASGTATPTAGHRRRSWTELRGWIFPVPLFRSDLRCRPGGRPSGGRHGARAAHGARLTSAADLGHLTAHADGPVRPRPPVPRGSVLPENLAGTPVHGTGLRTGVL